MLIYVHNAKRSDLLDTRAAQGMQHWKENTGLSLLPTLHYNNYINFHTNILIPQIAT